MQYSIIKKVEITGENTQYFGSLRSAKFDKLIVGIHQDGSQTNKLVASTDGELIKVEVVLRDKTSGLEKTLVNAYMKELMAYTDYIGGMASADADFMLAILHMGAVDLRDGSELNVSVSVGAVGSIDAATNPYINVYALKTDDLTNDFIRSYESYVATASGKISFQRVLELAGTTAADYSTIEIIEGDNSLLVNDMIAKMISLTVGRFESEVDFGVLYVDPTGTGRDIDVLLPKAYRLFAVKQLEI